MMLGILIAVELTMMIESLIVHQAGSASVVCSNQVHPSSKCNDLFLIP